MSEYRCQFPILQVEMLQILISINMLSHIIQETYVVHKHFHSVCDFKFVLTK